MRALFIATLMAIGSLDPGVGASALDARESTLIEPSAEDGVALANDVETPLSRVVARAPVDMSQRWRLAQELCPKEASRASSGAFARERRWRHRLRVRSATEPGH